MLPSLIYVAIRKVETLFSDEFRNGLKVAICPFLSLSRNERIVSRLQSVPKLIEKRCLNLTDTHCIVSGNKWFILTVASSGNRLKKLLTSKNHLTSKVTYLRILKGT